MTAREIIDAINSLTPLVLPTPYIPPNTDLQNQATEKLKVLISYLHPELE